MQLAREYQVQTRTVKERVCLVQNSSHVARRVEGGLVQLVPLA